MSADQTIATSEVARPPRRDVRLPPAGTLGAAIVALWTLVAIISPYIAPHDVGALVDDEVFGPIRWALPLGSDYLGRDALSRILVGACYSIGVAAAATFLAIVVGGTLGMLAAVSRGIRYDAGPLLRRTHLDTE